MADEVRALVQRSLAGDQTAMVALVGRYQSQVFGLCYRMLGQRQDAEDMAQETFVRAVQPESLGFGAGVFAVAAGDCGESLPDVPGQPDAAAAHVVACGTRCGRAAGHGAGRHLAEELQRALKRLREEYRIAFLLFHEQELSYADIGAALNCPLGTVKTWVHRARRELIETLRKREVVGEVSHAIRRI